MSADGMISKEAADYKDESANPAMHRCGVCTMVRKDPSTKVHYCTLVRGEVKDMGGCKFFDMDLIKNANSKVTLATNPPKKGAE